MSTLLDHIAIWLLDLVSSTRRVAGLYLTNFIFCTLVYMIAEHVSLFDAIWWCIVTWFTVGYGDNIPHTFEGKLFTMYAIVSSHALIVLITANFVIMLSRYRNKRHAHQYDFCRKHRKALSESVTCTDCNSPLSFF
jgi:uncharacterized membrane protein